MTEAQHSVEQALRDPMDDYGLAGVGSIACNNGLNPEVVRGAGFD